MPHFDDEENATSATLMDHSIYNNDEDDGFIYSPIECSSREMEGEDHDCCTNHDDFYSQILSWKWLFPRSRWWRMKYRMVSSVLYVMGCVQHRMCR